MKNLMNEQALEAIRTLYPGAYKVITTDENISWEEYLDYLQWASQYDSDRKIIEAAMRKTGKGIIERIKGI